MKFFKIKILIWIIVFIIPIIYSLGISSTFQKYQYLSNNIFRIVRTTNVANGLKYKIKDEFNLNNTMEVSVLTTYFKNEKIDYSTMHKVNNWLKNQFDVIPTIQARKKLLKNFVIEAYNSKAKMEDRAKYLKLLIENYRY